MKKYFVIAVLALVAVFAVSCNKNKKVDIVGHVWICHENIDTLDAHISMDISMDFINADSVEATTYIVTPVENETQIVRRPYTWDGEKNLVIYRTNEDNTITTRNLTYVKETEEFHMPLDQIEGDNTAQMIELMGIDELVFKKVK